MTIRKKEYSEIVRETQKFGMSPKFWGIIYVYGDIGSGKSFLLGKYAECLGEEYKVCFMQTDEVLRKDLNPFVYFLKNYFNQNFLQTEEENQDNFDKIYQATQRMFPAQDPIFDELTRIKSLIAGLIGIRLENSIYEALTPKDRFLSVKIAVKEFIKALSMIKPLVIIVDDIQWLDVESKRMFDLLFRNIEQCPIMAVASGEKTGKIEPKLTSVNISKEKIILLNEISLQEAKRFIKEKTGTALSDSSASYIGKKAGFSPFLIEQLSLYAKEKGLLKKKNGIFEISDKTSMKIDDLEAIIYSRVDTLSASVKNTLLAEAVLGKSCDPRIISEITRLIAKTTENGRAGKITEDSSSKNPTRNFFHISPLTEINYIMEKSPNHSRKLMAMYQDRIKEIHQMALNSLKDGRTGEMSKNMAYHLEKTGGREKAVSCYLKSGDFSMKNYSLDTALSSYEKALRLAEKFNDPGLIGRIYILLGDVFFEKSDYDKAIENYKKAIGLFKKDGLRAEKDLSDAYFGLGRTWHRKSSFRKAKIYFEKSLSLKKQKFGECHPDVARIYNSMGRFYFDMKRDCVKSAEFLNKALSIQEDVFGTENYETCMTLNDLGIIYGFAGDQDKAFCCLDRAQEVRTENENEKKMMIAKTCNNRAIVHSYKNEHEKAYQNMLKSLVIFREILGEKHINTAYLYHNAASELESIDENDKNVLQYFVHSNMILREILGENSQSAAISYNNIGFYYFRKKKYEDALKYFKKALVIYESILGDSHYLTALTKKNIGRCYLHLSKNQKAAIWLKSSLSGTRGEAKTTLSLRAEIYSDLGDVQKKSGDSKKAKLLYKKAIKIFSVIKDYENAELTQNKLNK